LPMLDAPAWIPRTLLFLLALGFVPALIFSWVFELTPEGLRREGEVPAEQSIMSETGQRMNHMIIAVLVLALGYFGFDKFVLTPRREAALMSTAHEEGAKEAATTAATAAANDKSVAVLPLANASGDKDQQYFSDGLSEGLIIALSRGFTSSDRRCRPYSVSPRRSTVPRMLPDRFLQSCISDARKSKRSFARTSTSCGWRERSSQSKGTDSNNCPSTALAW